MSSKRPPLNSLKCKLWNEVRSIVKDKKAYKKMGGRSSVEFFAVEFAFQQITEANLAAKRLYESEVREHQIVSDDYKEFHNQALAEKADDCPSKI